MWYPLIEIVFQFGSSRSQNAKMSVTMRSEDAAGRCRCRARRTP
jgi:hypothetical protein